MRKLGNLFALGMCCIGAVACGATDADDVATIPSPPPAAPGGGTPSPPTTATGDPAEAPAPPPPSENPPPADGDYRAFLGAWAGSGTIQSIVFEDVASGDGHHFYAETNILTLENRFAPAPRIEGTFTVTKDTLTLTSTAKVLLPILGSYHYAFEGNDVFSLVRDDVRTADATRKLIFKRISADCELPADCAKTPHVDCIGSFVCKEHACNWVCGGVTN